MFKFGYCIFSITFLLSHKASVSSVESENVVESRTINFGDVCDETIEENKFILISPKYPEEYPFNLTCQLNLKGPNCPTYYKFHFIDFDIQPSPGCVEDRLEIGLLDALCGVKNETKIYLAKNGTLSLIFKTNEKDSSRGFKILITRIEDCTKETSDSPRTLKTNTRDIINPNLKECCSGNQHTSNHFTLKSPNFPLSMSYPTDCLIQIHRASADVCRLRILFRFLWFGNSVDCSEGFMQIDGKIICGCKKELKLISTFDENVKTLRFRSAGLVRNSYSGFVAEIFQDDCPKKFFTTERNETILQLPDGGKALNFHTSQQNKPIEENIYLYAQDKNDDNEKEPNDFLATEDIDGLLGNTVNDFDKCLQWNQAQFDEIFYGKEIKLDQCHSAESINRKEKRCTTFMDQRGFILSPGYPFFYPGNLKICYRFGKYPGFCGVRIHFFDFRLGQSQSCSYERFEIDGRAYCGIDLWNKIVTLDLRYKEFEDLDFFTSSPRCVQGFKAYYEYLPCEEIITESPVPPPITRIYPVTPPVTEEPRQKCGGVIREEIFSLTNLEGSSECVFVVEKFTQEVCQLILNFERLEIDCNTEIIRINGKPFCSNRNTNQVTISEEEFPVEITYKNFGPRRRDARFKIRGFQDTISCQIPEPPAQLS